MTKTTSRSAVSVAMLVLAACGGSKDLGGGDQTPSGDSSNPDPVAVVCGPDYALAQRTASLALMERSPNMGELQAMLDADGNPAAQKAAYEKFVDQALSSKEFAISQVRFFHNMFATGNLPNQKMRVDNMGNMQYMPDQDCAATFAARVVVTDQPYTSLFTATAGTCPKFDEATGLFSDGDVIDDQGQPVEMAGILNDPGIQKNFASNMAMRRVRFVQETFACQKFPAESGGTPQPMGAALYTSPWPFTSITGASNATGGMPRVDFQDTSAVICANCHTTMNHLAPLFANFSMATGLMTNSIQVRVPVPGTPTATLSDWLPQGESTAWRFNTPVATIADLGRAMAADKDVSTCFTNRIWDHALSRGDIVRDLATVPTDVTSAIAKNFATNNYNVKKLIREVFVSDAYVNQQTGGAR